MALHPTIAAALASTPAPPPGPIEPAVIRRFEESQVPPVEDRLPVASVEDTTVSGVPVRVYADAVEPAGTLVYLHGGAFFLGGLDTHDHLARELAKATGLRVVSVGYRLAPEHAFPAGLEDCWAVVRAIAAETPPTLAVAGDSSGGTFVAALVALAKDEGVAGITHQVLYYPSLDLDFDGALAEGRYRSLAENAEGYGLTTAALKPFNAFYLDSGADPADPRVSPIRRGDLSGLPPALVITAEHDPLRDEGELYAARLEAAGVPVTLHRYAGANHGFVQHFCQIPEFHAVFAETAAFLDEHRGVK